MRCCPIVEFGKPLVEMELPTPEPAGDAVLLRVTGCGVCHSDLHIHDGYFDLGDGRKADLTRNCELPFCLGHEIVGTVVAMGETASGVAIGDSVVVYPWIGCGECPVCAADDEHFCPKHRSLGVVANGGFADHLIVPHAKYLFDHGNVPGEVACTYACSGLTAFSAIRKAAKTGAGHIVMIGAGGVGLAGLAIARNVTDATITVCDIDDAKLEAASAMGADHVVNSSAADAAKQIRSLTGGGAPAIVDFVGVAASVGFGGFGRLRHENRGPARHHRRRRPDGRFGAALGPAAAIDRDDAHRQLCRQPGGNDRTDGTRPRRQDSRPAGRAAPARRGAEDPG